MLYMRRMQKDASPKSHWNMLLVTVSVISVLGPSPADVGKADMVFDATCFRVCMFPQSLSSLLSHTPYQRGDGGYVEHDTISYSQCDCDCDDKRTRRSL